jgi:hypothetical protein
LNCQSDENVKGPDAYGQSRVTRPHVNLGKSGMHQTSERARILRQMIEATKSTRRAFLAASIYGYRKRG